jgi:hypothetical protein
MNATEQEEFRVLLESERPCSERGPSAHDNRRLFSGFGLSGV